jgi:hypothetical protein
MEFTEVRREEFHSVILNAEHFKDYEYKKDGNSKSKMHFPRSHIKLSESLNFLANFAYSSVGSVRVTCFSSFHIDSIYL